MWIYLGGSLGGNPIWGIVFRAHLSAPATLITPAARHNYTVSVTAAANRL